MYDSPCSPVTRSYATRSPCSASPTYEISLLVKGKSSGGKNYFSSIHVGNLREICVANNLVPTSRFFLLTSFPTRRSPCRFSRFLFSWNLCIHALPSFVNLGPKFWFTRRSVVLPDKKGALCDIKREGEQRFDPKTSEGGEKEKRREKER